MKIDFCEYLMFSDANHDVCTGYAKKVNFKNLQTQKYTFTVGCFVYAGRTNALTSKWRFIIIYTFIDPLTDINKIMI